MKKLVLLTVFLPFIYTSFSQYPEIHYERIFNQPGLNDNGIGCLLQDSKGFIWFGGENGLYRFDGYNIVYYKDPPGCKNCPPFAPAYDVVEDNHGMLWTISYKGIILYDSEKERSWEAYRFKSARTLAYQIKTWDLMKDSRGNIWATKDYGIVRFSYQENFNSKDIRFNKDLKNILNIDFFNLSQDTSPDKNVAIKIYEDSEGNIWTSCVGGLYVMRKEDSSFYMLEIGVEMRARSDTIIWDILQQNKDTFWIGTGALNYLYLMTNVKKALHGLVPDCSALSFTKFVVSKDQLTQTLYKDRKNNIFIGTSLDVFKFKGRDEKAGLTFESLYKNMLDKKDYLTTKYTWSMLEDRTGMLWIGHRTFGIMKFNPDRSQFISYKDLVSNTFTSTDILDIHFDTKDNLWMGAYGGGLYRFQKENNLITRYDLGERGNRINCFEETYPGIFWVGFDEGVFEFNTMTGKSHDPLPEGKIAENLRNTIVTNMLKDQNQLYITSWDGLFVYDLIKKRLVQFLYPRNDSILLLNNQMFSPIKLKNREIIAASAYHGLLRINYEAEKGNLSVNCIVADSVLRRRNINLSMYYQLYQDSQGTLWMVGNTGLHRINPGKGEIYNYKLFKNREFPQAGSIIEDNHGNLWIGTNFGLCRFNMNTGQVKNFTKDDGVSIDLHQLNAVCKDKDGRLYFGGFGGFYSFHPDSIKTNTDIPPIAITDFRLFNKSVSVDTTKKAILTKNISYTSRIELRHNQNDLSFEFAALDYTLPLRNQYAYKLEGYQDEWIETNADNRIATFTNLNPGKYVFRVKGSNNDGIWNEEGTFINIIIHPPFWRTIWAYIAYVVFFLLLLRGYIYWRTSSLRKEKLVLEKQVNERTEELHEVNTLLEEQNEELMQQKEELQTTLENLQKTQEQLVESEKMAAVGGLVTGVAHEINTPVGIGITAISNLLDDIQRMASLFEKDKISRNDFKEFLQSSHDVSKLIQKNLERTASLVQSFKQVSTDQATEQQRVFELKEYLNDILLSLRPKFSGKKIEFKIECNDKLKLNSYPGVYAQIFTNLLLNSLQHGFPEMDTGTIGIKADINKDLLKIQYSDDGAGISKKDLPHIFEPFYTSDQHRGTGLGLNIVYNLIKQKLHGIISCESEPGKGVLFKIEVPLIR
jgi:signal transduction histidine kinase/ligand-binding sensor domain-containing protein